MPIDKYQVSLKVFLKDSQGRVLFLGNPIDEFGHADYCDLPGGRINVDEFKVSLMDILEREIREELGEVKTEIDPQPIGYARGPLRSSGGDVHVFYVVYQGRFLEGEIKISAEHKDFCWIKPEMIDVTKTFKPEYREAMKECLNCLYA